MKRLWVFTSRFPYPIEKGDKLRLYFQLKELSKFYSIHLFCLHEESPAKDHYVELEKYCESIDSFPIRKTVQFGRTFLSFANKLPLQVGYFNTPSLKKHIYSCLQNKPPDLIYCHLIRMTEYVKDIPVPKVLDYMDSFSLGMFRAANNSKTLLWRLIYRVEAQLCQYYERDIHKYFDASTIISAQDRDAIQLLTNQNITVVRNGIDIEQFYFENDLVIKPKIVFIGNLGYTPNMRAVLYLVDHIMPALWELYPDAKLMVAGARPTEWMKRLDDPRIEIRGWVEDIRQAYSDGSIFVAPLFTGSGMQNKILEAMAVGVPCITTPIVNNSIKAKEPDQILIAENVTQFVSQIDALLQNPNQFHAIRQAARSFVENHFPWDMASQALLSLLENVYDQHNQQQYVKSHSYDTN